MRNEGPSVAEWVVFHALMGATSFTIYDDGSTDDLASVVTTLQQEYAIELVPWPPSDEYLSAHKDERKFADKDDAAAFDSLAATCQSGEGRSNQHGALPCQITTIRDCTARFKSSVDFFSTHDVDEFIWALPSVPLALDAISDPAIRHASQVPIDSTMFGSNYVFRRPPGKLVIETFTRRAPYSDYGEDVDAIRQADPACEMKTSEFGESLCKYGPCKVVMMGRNGPPWRVQKAHVHGIGGNAAPLWNRTANPLKLWHFQQKSMLDVARRGRDWHKADGIERAIHSATFWNYALDESLLQFAQPVREHLRRLGL